MLPSLVDVAGGHPQDTMQLAAELLHAADDSTTHHLTMEGLEIATTRVETALDRAFQEAWNALKPVEQHVLKRVAAGAGPYEAPSPHRARVQRAVDTLVDAGLLDHPRRGAYAYVERLFARYVARLTEVAGEDL